MSKRRQALPNEELIDRLIAIPDHELSDVLREVFVARQLYPREAKYHRAHFVLAIAQSWLDDREKGQEQREPWDLIIVAYPDREIYKSGGPQNTLYQYADCQGCGLALASNAKNAICAVCGTTNYLSSNENRRT